MLEIEFVSSENCYSHDLSGDATITYNAAKVIEEKK
jgi:hypothetical protein